MIDLQGKRVIVIGLGTSGVSAAKLCLRLGARVTGVDTKTTPPAGLEGVTFALGANDAADLNSADLVVISPGVPSFPALQRTKTPIWGEIELAYRALSHAAPVVAIGGTNGKSTVTTLVGELLSADGKKVFVGGNLGEPLADHVEERFDVVVLEVSSFQMERVDAFRPHVAALLNITPDHLDRYASFDDYARAKGNCFARQTPEDFAVIPENDAVCEREARRGEGTIVTFSARDVDPGALAIQGGHNVLNAAAAVKCVRPFGVREEIVAKVLREFRGLPHRMALVAEIGGVVYYDDSKGTNVGASVTALETLREDKAVLIAGGRDKGGSYEPLARALEKKGRALVVIGEASELIARAADGVVPVHRARTMDEAVALASKLARPGDAVLLSPACSSFDMFRDYKHRGDEFVRAVKELSR